MEEKRKAREVLGQIDRTEGEMIRHLLSQEHLDRSFAGRIEEDRRQVRELL